MSRENLYLSAMGLRVERKAKCNIFKEYFLTSNRLRLSYSAPGAHTYKAKHREQFSNMGSSDYQSLLIPRAGALASLQGMEKPETR